MNSPRMRGVHVGRYLDGGSGRAMLRIANAVEQVQKEQRTVELSIFSPVKKWLPSGSATWGDFSRLQWAEIFLEKNIHRIRSRLVFRPAEPTLISVARVSTPLPEKIEKAGFDFVHLHWLGDDVMSIEQIGAINVPIIWTLHDMWPFCGSEHISTLSRYLDGYSRGNRPATEFGPDINLETWQRKRLNWKKPMLLVSPSKWLARAASQSALFKYSQVEVIPNPVDTTYWGAISRAEARNRLGWKPEELVLLFGSSRGTRDKNKGGHLLVSLAERMGNLIEERAEIPAPKIVVFGENKRTLRVNGISIEYEGYVNDEVLRDLYSGADATLMLSRVDNFPSVVAESMAAGTPVIGLDSTGVGEIVQENITGRLVSPGDISSLAQVVCNALQNRKVLREQGYEAARYVEEEMNPTVVGESYLRLYHQVARRKE